MCPCRSGTARRALYDRPFDQSRRAPAIETSFRCKKATVVAEPAQPPFNRCASISVMAIAVGPPITFVPVLSRSCAQGRFIRFATAGPWLDPLAASPATMSAAAHATRRRVRCVHFVTALRGKPASAGPCSSGASPWPESSQAATTINSPTRRRLSRAPGHLPRRRGEPARTCEGRARHPHQRRATARRP